jgi:hypothetical protein
VFFSLKQLLLLLLLYFANGYFITLLVLRSFLGEFHVFHFTVLFVCTERCVQVFNTLASHSGGPVLKFRLGDQLSWQVFVVFLGLSRQMPVQYLKLGHERFLPHPFQFIIQLPSFHSTIYILSYWESVLNKLKTSCFLFIEYCFSLFYVTCSV